jgi:hypothetical protein
VPADRAVQRFPFAFRAPLAPLSWLFGATPWTSSVVVDEDELLVRYGPWVLRTPLADVVGAEVTGPYRWWRVAGPARLSVADRGLTFATSLSEGVCIRFAEPVPAISPRGLPPRHPGLTVTVEQPGALVDVLHARTA